MAKVDPNSIAICITTLYPKWYSGGAKSLRNIDKVRGDLCLRTLKTSTNRGYQTFVGYGGNSPEFQQKLENIDGLHLMKRVSQKREPAKRQLIDASSKTHGVKAIVITEGEKVSFVKHCIEKSVSPIIKGYADIVIPKREENLFKKTYPRYMYESEIEANMLCHEELVSHQLIKPDSEQFDLFFGPRVFANERKVLQYVLQDYKLRIKSIAFNKLYFDSEDLSNTQFLSIVRALQKNLHVKSITVPFKYPATQKENEELHAKDVFLEKRKAQRLGLIIELLHFVSFLEENPGTRIKKSA